MAAVGSTKSAPSQSLTSQFTTPIKSEFAKLFGPWTPICKSLFYKQTNKQTQSKVFSKKKESLHFQSISDFIIFVPKTRCSQKKSSFSISLRFCNFRPANKVFPKKKGLHFGQVSDFMV